MTYLDTQTSKKDFQNFLLLKGWLFDNEEITTVEKAGDGNMNVVLRVETNRRSFILKQSRPYVQKYQEIKAPLNRIDIEYQFYRAVNNPTIRQHFPKILAYDPSNYLMQLEDLGDCDDMTYIYKQRTIDKELVGSLVKLLFTIHNSTPPRGYPSNEILRQLNHQHIFALPFQLENGFQLDIVQQGLQELSIPYKNDQKIKEAVKKIGAKYLGKGKVLIHGDYYPGSWMTKGSKVFVIDPEFSFIGFAEFDLGVMSAHLFMTTMEPSSIRGVLDFYEGQPDVQLVSQVAGIEIMRRLIGLAQLPLERSLEEKDYLLQIAKKMILT